MSELDLALQPYELRPDGGATFLAATRFLLPHEGRLSDDRNDPGGVTNFGVSLRFAQQLGDQDGDGWADLDIDHDGDVDAADIRAMTLADAIGVYHREWWLKNRYGELPPLIAAKLLDLSVNAGSVQAHRLIQRALRSLAVSVVDDGVLGLKTRSAIQACPPAILRAALCSEAAGFYRLLAALRPTSAGFLVGWLNRAYA